MEKNQSLNQMLENRTQNEQFVTGFLTNQDNLNSATHWLAIMILAEVAFTTGVCINFDSFKENLKDLKPIFISAFIHFVTTPVTMFAWLKLFKMPLVVVVVIITIASLPGGLVATLLVSFVNGDKNLSSFMSAVFTLLSFAILPLFLYVFSSDWLLESHKHDDVIAYSRILFTFLLMTIPIVFGGLISKVHSNAANKLANVFSVLLFVTLVAFVILISVTNEDTLLIFMSGELWLVCGVTPLLGFFVSFVLASICHLVGLTRRTVMVEAISQNGPLASAMLRLFFPVHFIGVYSIFPIVFSLVQFVESLLFVAIVRYQLKREEEEKENAFFALGGVPVGRIRKISLHAIDKIRRSLVRSRSSDITDPVPEIHHDEKEDQDVFMTSSGRSNVIKMAISEEVEQAAVSEKNFNSQASKTKKKDRSRSVQTDPKKSHFEDIDISKSD